jgi:UDP-glucose 4-epimerase
MESKIVITGGAGFIGSQLADSLINKCEHVVVIDNLTTGNINNIIHLMDKTNFTFYQEDCRNKEFLYSICPNTKIIYHLAASVGVKLVVESPRGTILNNIISTDSVLSVAEFYKSKVFLASSSEVYGCGNGKPLSENESLNIENSFASRWSYSASKIVDEMLVSSYSYNGLEAIVGRFFNIIGIRQKSTYGMVVPRFIQQALKNKPITIYGNGSQTRCFCDVKDAVRAVIQLTSGDNYCFKHTLKDGVEDVGIFNIGSDSEISILELAHTIKQMTNSVSEIVFIPYSSISKGFVDIQKRKPNLEKINERLGWMPSITLGDTLIELIQFEREKLNTNLKEKNYA